MAWTSRGRHGASRAARRAAGGGDPAAPPGQPGRLRRPGGRARGAVAIRRSPRGRRGRRPGGAARVEDHGGRPAVAARARVRGALAGPGPAGRTAAGDLRRLPDAGAAAAGSRHGRVGAALVARPGAAAHHHPFSIGQDHRPGPGPDVDAVVPQRRPATGNGRWPATRSTPARWRCWRAPHPLLRIDRRNDQSSEVGRRRSGKARWWARWCMGCWTAPSCAAACWPICAGGAVWRAAARRPSPTDSTGTTAGRRCWNRTWTGPASVRSRDFPERGARR